VRLALRPFEPFELLFVRVPVLFDFWLERLVLAPFCLLEEREERLEFTSVRLSLFVEPVVPVKVPPLFP
jgi:hypothetical protein